MKVEKQSCMGYSQDFKNKGQEGTKLIGGGIVLNSTQVMYILSAEDCTHQLIE